MKSLIQSVLIATALAAPVAVFAQSNAPVTRAQVKAELVQFAQAAGPRAFSNDPYYPNRAQMAQARIDAQGGNSEAVGGAHAGSSASGSPVAVGTRDSLYFGR